MIPKRPSSKHISIEEQLLSHDGNLVLGARKKNKKKTETTKLQKTLKVTTSKRVLKLPCGAFSIQCYFTIMDCGYPLSC